MHSTIGTLGLATSSREKLLRNVGCSASRLGSVETVRLQRRARWAERPEEEGRMTHPLGSLTSTRHPSKRLASGGGHAHPPHSTATRATRKDVGKVQLFLRAGTVLSMPKGPLPASY